MRFKFYKKLADSALCPPLRFEDKPYDTRGYSNQGDTAIDT